MVDIILLIGTPHQGQMFILPQVTMLKCLIINKMLLARPVILFYICLLLEHSLWAQKIMLTMHPLPIMIGRRSMGWTMVLLILQWVMEEGHTNEKALESLLSLREVAQADFTVLEVPRISLYLLTCGRRSQMQILKICHGITST